MLIVFLTALMFSSFPVLAMEENSPDENEKVTMLVTTERIPQLAKDPFCPLVKRPEKRFEIKPKEIEKAKVAKVEQIPVKPLEIKINGICGNESRRHALIEFENSALTVQAGQTVNGKFNVIEVTENSVVVFSIAQQRRAVFKIG